MYNQEGREVVVVTGASAGLGRAIARAFGRRRACVGLIARGIDGLEAARREIENAGGKAIVLPTDVADADGVEADAAAVEEAFGPIDIWINNAMASVFSPVSQMKPEEYRRVTEVTYLGTVYGTLAALRRMLRRDQGTIVQIGSALAYRSIPLQSAYCAAKHAIAGFTESLRTELIHESSHVYVTMVQMPALNTPQFGWVKSRLPRKAQPVPPIYQPEAAADAVLWAIKHKRKEVDVGMLTSFLLKANSVAPAVGDWYMGLTGYESQMTNELEDPNRTDNLWEPMSGDHGAHGAFDDRAHSSTLLPGNQFRNLITICAGLATGGFIACKFGRRI
jgi:short-subunit dehydrogenase